MQYYTNLEKIKLEKLERMQRMRTKEIEKMMETDEDIDLSTVGQKYEKKKFSLIKEVNPVKESIHEFLNIQYALELSSIGFVVFIFIVFSIVRINE